MKVFQKLQLLKEKKPTWGRGSEVSWEGGGHSRTAKDDALVKKEKNGEPGLRVLRLENGLLGRTESHDKTQLKTITL